MSSPAARPRRNRRKGRREDNPNVRLSKKLSYVLRHGGVDAGLSIDDAGYVKLDDLLSLQGFGSFTADDVARVLEQNDKQRFSFLEHLNGVTYIRANQGHSGSVSDCINPEKLLYRLALADVQPECVCLHGTTVQAWKSIKEEGLSRMKRTMIHCAAGLPEDDQVISGMRSSCKVLIYIDVYRAVKDGIPFFRSENEVLLTPGVGQTGMLPVAYFKKTLMKDTGDVLMENAVVSQT